MSLRFEISILRFSSGGMLRNRGGLPTEFATRGRGGCWFTRGGYQRLFVVATPCSWQILSLLALLLATSAVSSSPIPIAVPIRDKPVDFETEILPILRANCTACHSERKKEAGLVLETPQGMAKGGETGPAVIAGKSAESLLVKVAAHQQETFMPPAENQVGARPLNPAQLGLIKLWIDQGAGGTVSASRSVRWQPLPGGHQPIFATAVTPDGQYAACSRGNQIDVYHVPSGKLAAKLIDPVTGPAHADVIRSLAFDPKGELLASGGFREVKLWRRPRMSVKSPWPQDAPLTAVAVSESGVLAAVGDEKGQVRIIEVAVGTARHSITAHQSEVTALAFSADNSVVFSASLDKTLRAWNVSTGAAMGTSVQAGMPLTGLATIKGGEWLVSGEEDGRLKVWETKALHEAAAGLEVKPLKEIKAHGEAVTALAVDPGQPSEVVSAGKDGLIRRWDAAEGKQLKEFRHEAPVVALAMRADGKRIASAGENHIVRLWNAEDGQTVAQIQGDPRLAERVAQLDAAVAFTKSALELTKGDIKSYEGPERRVMVTAMDVKKAEEEKTKAEKMLEEKRQALEKTKNEKKDDAKAIEQAQNAIAEAMTAVQVAGTIIERAKVVAERAVADFAAAQKTAADHEETLKQQQGAKEAAVNAAKAVRPIRSLAFSNERLLVGCEDGALCTYDSEQGAPADVHADHTAAIRGMVSLGGDAFLSSSADKRAIFWNAPSAWKLERTIGGMDHPELLIDRVLALDFSPDGQYLATGGGVPSRSAELKVWNVSSGQLARAMPAAHEDTIFAVKFSPDGQHLASAGADRMVKVFNSGSGEPERVFAGHTAHVLAVSWHAGGKLLVSSGTDKVLKQWDFEKGLPVRTMKGTTYQIGPYKGEVTSAQFIGSSEQILACSGDGTVRLHRSTSENDILTFAGAKGYQYSVSATPDGQTLVAGGSDGVLRIWTGQNRDPKRILPPGGAR